MYSRARSNSAGSYRAARSRRDVQAADRLLLQPGAFGGGGLVQTLRGAGLVEQEGEIERRWRRASSSLCGVERGDVLVEIADVRCLLAPPGIAPPNLACNRALSEVLRIDFLAFLDVAIRDDIALAALKEEECPVAILAWPTRSSGDSVLPEWALNAAGGLTRGRSVAFAYRLLGENRRYDRDLRKPAASASASLAKQASALVRS
ncbi:MAG: hypothetical protein U0232_16870 [Thermomicrobiales bacterium]